MIHVKENALEWARKHLTRYYDSDFFPKSFEFEAISNNWGKVKEHILNLDLFKYTPKSPFICLAPKANGTFRIVHKLDPIDSLIFTALVYEIHDIIEGYRIPVSKKIACSYRVKPDINGSFFNREENGWKHYKSQTKKLSQKFKKGYVINCDITDFYNQIYTHRLQNIISEAGGGDFDNQATILEKFLLKLNTKTSRGIPVGPAASIVLAEALMSDIDKKIMSYTSDFVRWVDDIIIFFETKDEAVFTFHELTKYLYSSHRLVFSGEKSRILPVKKFLKYYFRDEEKDEATEVLRKTEELAQEKFDEIDFDISPYDIYDSDIEEILDAEYARIYENVSTKEQFKILSGTYKEILKKSISAKRLNTPLLRHIFRNATKYRVRSLIPLTLKHFEHLIPITREVIIYLNRVINAKTVEKYEKYFLKIIENPIMKLPFINMWVSYLLQNNHFNAIDFPKNYNYFLEVHDIALIAKRKKDITWVKDHKDGVDVLGPWDRRAILYSAEILSRDEMRHWTKHVAEGGDILDKSISALLLSKA